jgi:predicted small lipoprotein YifL
MLNSHSTHQTVILNVKSSTALIIAAAAVVSVLCAGCGQTGPLYLPKPAGKTVVPATPAQTAAPQTSEPSTPAQ